MIRHNIFRLAFALLMGTALALPGAPTAVSQSPIPPPPTNDNFANAIVIGALPFSDTRDISGATTEPGEPQPCSVGQTVWYSITPAANAVVRADMAGSSFFDTSFNVYRAVGPGFGGLNFVGCAQFGGSVTFSVQAGTTYYVQAGRFFGGGGNLQVNLQEIPPPPNDNFSNATLIAAPPFSDTVDTAGASREAGEPTSSCAQFNEPAGTVWYAFTPGESRSVSAFVDNTFFFFSTDVAVYTGNSLNNLVEVGCRSSFGGRLTFRANQGTTYYFQVAGLFGQGGSLRFNLIVTPPPEANFGFFPSDPSVFDPVQFFDQSFDPGEVGFQSRTWDFGDGTTLTTTDCCPTHRYTADGDYTVQLTVTTFDGRTASTSPVVQVRTHDVAITKFSVPKAASAGQTRQIVVGINSRRYLENVEVQLFKSVPGGFQSVGTLNQFVPVRPSNRTTNFNFSYTFTSEDANVGKVTFKAVANIVGARDALPADNEAIARPTKVTR